jgi:uncharacterized protein YcgI (DUF1989 family)
MPPVAIPARTGDYVSLQAGQRLKLINPQGNQVIDFWAFTFAPSPPDGVPTSFVRSEKTTTTAVYPFASGVQYFSASRTRSILSKLVPSAEDEDVLYTNKSVPLLTLVEDTTAGVHDTLFGCCDRFRYQNLGWADHSHASCAENMHLALQKAVDAGAIPAVISSEWTPDPLNVFMNVPVTTPLDRASGGGRIECVPPHSRPGEYLVLRAEVDCVAVMSACPNDVIPGVNAGRCTGVEYEVL